MASGGEPLCNLAVIWVGSRRLPGTSACVAALSAPFSSTHRRRATLGQRLPWVIRGSRLLATDRAAILQKRLPSRRWVCIKFTRRNAFEDDGRRRRRLRTAQQPNIQSDRENKNHADKRVALEKRPINPGQIQTSRSSVFVKQRTAHR